MASSKLGAWLRRTREELSLRGRRDDTAKPFEAPVILVVGVLCLAGIEYLGSANKMPELALRLAMEGARAWEGASGLPELLRPTAGFFDERLLRLSWWSGSCVFFYLLLPGLTLRAICGRSLRDAGLGRGRLFTHLPVYLALIGLMIPAVLFAARQPGFRRMYPFYPGASRSLAHLLLWELVYGAQFISLEFFFRGFLIQGLRPTMGLHALFVAVVPYCMIHFGKPGLETLGAVVAGLVLGTLALLSRSIWGGVLLHVGVALSMDLISLSLKG